MRSHSRHKSYTPLTMTTESILKECFNAEFKEENIEFMLSIKEIPWEDKIKYSKFHKGHKYITKEYVQLKDVIESLIKKGKLTKYTNEKNGMVGDGQRGRDHLGHPPSPMRLLTIEVMVWSSHKKMKTKGHP